MSASSLRVVALEYSYQTPNSPASWVALQPPSFTFSTEYPSFGVLSSNTHTSGTDVEGFLYSHNFSATDQCSNITTPIVGVNTTRLSNLPAESEFSDIAFGPWVKSDCIFEILDGANLVNAKAFVTYLPGRVDHNNYSAAAPPDPSDPAWDLGDNGAWKTKYGFPVYALNSNDGSLVQTMLSNYSGPIQTVPQGSMLANQFGHSANVRLYMQSQVSSNSPLPQLWVFLLIVVAVLIGVLLLASIVMRVIHRRRRNELRRMILNGEVNLEVLGIGRVKVTEDVLRKMSLFIYVNHGETPGAPHAPPREAEDAGAVEVASSDNAATKKQRRNPLEFLPFARLQRVNAAKAAAPTALPAIMEEKAVSFPQDTCAICLEDFENHVTPVRGLPCGHAFHPACVDPLLREYSSLCPICKASVLPKDYVPEVTNVMVRRERLMRRIRDLEAQDRTRDQRIRASGGPAHFRGIGRFVQRTSDSQTQAHGANAGNATTPNQGGVEMQNLTVEDTSVQRSTSNVSAADNSARRPENVSREEWARQRAQALVGTNETVEQAELREQARLPMWRRWLGPVFPTLRS